MEADTLLGIAKAFHAAGAGWTVSTENFDAINYGMFYSDDVLEKVLNRLLEVADRLKCKTVVIGECGHATKAGLLFKSIYGRPEYRGVRFQNIIEASHGFLKAGKLKMDPSKNPGAYTYHDPCNLGRGAGLYDEPRALLKAAVETFVEMTPNRQMNYCCGGGGGQLAMAQYRDRRIGSGGIKAEQIRRTAAKTVVAPCHNCIDQLMELNKEYKLGVQVKTVAEMVADALQPSTASFAEVTP